MTDFLKEEAEALPGAFSQYDMMAILPALEAMGPDDVYLEVGVDQGRSLKFARNHSKGWVYGIDLHHKIKLDAFEGDEKLKFIHAASNEAVKNWDKQIDVLFIDGDHTYEGVADDFNNFVPFVKPGGLIYFHDCDDTSPDVRRLWDGITWEKGLSRDQLDDRNTSVAWVRKPL